jgi:hypothetical protein
MLPATDPPTGCACCYATKALERCLVIANLDMSAPGTASLRALLAAAVQHFLGAGERNVVHDAAFTGLHIALGKALKRRPNSHQAGLQAALALEACRCAEGMSCMLLV